MMTAKLLGTAKNESAAGRREPERRTKNTKEQRVGTRELNAMEEEEADRAKRDRRQESNRGIEHTLQNTWKKIEEDKKQIWRRVCV